MGGGASSWLVPLVLGVAAAGAAYALDHLPRPAAPAEPVPFEGSVPTGDLRFGVDGVETVRATLHVFKADGTLLGSNAPPDETARFVKDGDFRELPGLTLHLGNGTPPAGALALPPELASLRRQLHENLTGQRVGEVVETTLVDYPWLDLFGPLRLVARIDGLPPPLRLDLPA